MMMKGRRLSALLLLCSCTAAAGVGTWKNFTSMKDVRGIARDGHTYWAASGGGMFRWDEGSANYKKFTNAEGLSTLDLTATCIDAHGDVWTGASTGALHVYSPPSGSLRIVPDIASFPGQTDKHINALTSIGDTVLISIDFGLSVYRVDRGEFGDTYTRFGSIPTNVRVACFAATITGGRLWAAISDGVVTHRIASASLSSPNLLEPQAWTLETVGGPAAVPHALAVFAGRLYAGTTAGLFAYNGTTWQAVPLLSGKSIVALSPSASTLAACTTTGEVWTVEASDNAQTFGATLPFTPTSLVTGADGQPVAGCLDGGISTWASPAWEPHFPNGPNSNQFVSVAVGPDGTVWCASGQGAGKGLYRLNAAGWKSFTRQNSPLPIDQVYRVSIGCNGSVWASLYGRGIVEIPAGTDAIDPTRIYGRNVGMIGIPNDTSYIVPSTVACDGPGNVWMVVDLAADKRVFAVRKSNNTWLTLPLILGGTKVTNPMDQPGDRDRPIAIDASDNLWSTVRDAGVKGIVSFGNGGAIDSIVSLKNLVTAADGLPSDEVKTIVVDKENDLWVGTDRGIGIILDPLNPKRSGGIAAYKPLDGLVINTIAVDPLNQKWIGTSEGVVLLSPDGTQQLANFTVENTQGKLIDNDVKCITVDELTGTVYFGTTLGLASLTTAAAAPKTDFDKLLAYPNPYLVPSSTPVAVDGFVTNSTMKVLASDGTLVREIKTPGGRVGFWDGLDERGNVVASGVYILVGYSEDGSQTGMGKIAVIRSH